MMKKILALLLALVLIAGLVACTTTPEPEEPAVPDPPEVEVSPEPEEPEEEEEPVTGSAIHGAIHRVEYGDNVVYLFGTLHGGHDHWFPLADVVEDALRRSDVLAIEVDDIAEGADAMEEAIMEALFLPDGMTWAELLPTDAYDHLVEAIAGWGIPYEDVNDMNPAFLVFSLEMELVQSLAVLEVNIDASVDAYVVDVAMELGLPIIGLESIEQQIDILFHPPFEVMLAQIMSFLPPMELMERIEESGALSLDELATLYENNDLEALIHAFGLEIGADAEDLFAIYMREIVMNWRSTYYANEIIRLLQETEEPTTFFVAVGLSHIIRAGAGEEFTDIVEQLELQGFTAVPIWE